MFAVKRRYHQKLGRAGENAVCKLLEHCGMTILARNWRCRAGELDIVALDGEEIVFVEVKTTRYRPDFTPSANLSFRQRRRNYNAAKVYLRSLDITGRTGRFDLIEVTYRWIFMKSIIRHRDYLPPLPAREEVIR
jgi:putative endonuclease